MRGSGRPARGASVVWMIGAAMLLAAGAPVLAQWRMFDSDVDEKPWAEVEAQLPPPPRNEHLIPFAAESATGHRYYIDETSLSVGEDRVVRYTLVVKAAGGATNVTFEGMRCETFEHKQYAVGHADGKWARARDPQWRRIEYRDRNRHHHVLYFDFFCPERHVRMVTVKQMLAALRQARGNLR